VRFCRGLFSVFSKGIPFLFADGRVFVRRLGGRFERLFTPFYPFVHGECAACFSNLPLPLSFFFSEIAKLYADGFLFSDFSFGEELWHDVSFEMRLFTWRFLIV